MELNQNKTEASATDQSKEFDNFLKLLSFEGNWNPHLFKQYERFVTEENKEKVNKVFESEETERSFVQQYTRWLNITLNGPSIKPITAAELATMELPPINWIVPGLLPTGVSLLAGKPKSYKSFFALQLCLAVCNGETFLNRECQKASCLYFDLESGNRRPQDRIKKILNGRQFPNNLYIVTKDAEGTTEAKQFKTIGTGFEQRIEEMLIAYPDIKLVVIDVYQKVRAGAKKTDSGYDRDYRDMAILKSLQNRYDVCILLIHHARKMKADDVFDEINGSVGLLGSVDVAMMISKEHRSDEDAMLNITGRDVEEQELSIRFDKNTLTWKYRGTAEEIENNNRREQYDSDPVIEAARRLVFRNRGNWTGSVTEFIRDAAAYGVTIDDDARSVGKTLNDFRGELWGWDEIHLDFNRTSEKRAIRLYC